MHMSKKNIFISHRWSYPEDYTSISGAVDRTKFEISDRSVEKSNPLEGTKKEISDSIKNKIDSSSIVLAPAREAALTKGSVGRDEINYAISKNKKIIAVNSNNAVNIPIFWANNSINVVSCRKDSIENEIKRLENKN